MPLTEEQRRRLQGRLGTPSTSGGLPPEIRAIAERVPNAQPYLQSVGTSGPRIAYPKTRGVVEQELGLEAAKQQIRRLNPTVGEAIKRDFARIDAFEGILSDLESTAKNFRKGPIQGTYAKLGAKATGGGEFPGVQASESEDILNYSDLRPGVAAGLYRAVTGDDRISDRDAAQRALPFVPDPYLQPKAFAKRLKLVKRAIQRKRQSIRKSLSLGQSPSTEEGEDSSGLFYSIMNSAFDEELDD